ncbi:MAG TPA: molybdopterin cofactor-binding domain-containing protein [Lunatimonas sp.]|nr:molybdopterin cofactor-binding domain-containing protein [Lunatimonas sp.]
MKKSLKPVIDLYPEQYELHQQDIIRGPITRRKFFKRMGLGIASFIVVSDVVSAELMDQMDPSLAEDTIASWIHIDESGKITVYTGKVEVGQNIRTSLTQVVAEELFVEVEDIHLIMGDTDLTPYDRGTYGSLTTPQMAPILRKAAASLRELLKETAAKEWSVGKGGLQMEKGIVFHPSNGKRLSYSQLSQGKKLFQQVNTQVEVVPVSSWKVAGTSVPKVDGKSFITGRHKYVSDMVLPGMVYGKILRAPANGATLKNLDTSRAEAMEGVKVVRDGDFVGVTAPDSPTANMALAMIEASWDRTPQPSRKELFDHLKNTARSQPESKSEVTTALNQASYKLDQTFTIDYIAHVPLEPRAGVAEWVGDKLTVWTGTQRPFGVQEELQRAFDIPKENIRVIMPDTGSGYGGKHTGEAGIEAAKLAKATGKPVKVTWTREEEFKWAYLRPAGVIDVRSGMDSSGKVTAWEFHNYNSGNAGIQAPYTIAAKHDQFLAADTPLRQGSYRALASTANIFAIESQFNDLAAENGTDPLAFRLRHLQDERLTNALKACAEKFGWDKPRKEGHGFGIACGAVKGGFVATCAEVRVHPESGEVKVLRLVTSFECGAIINPRHLESQVVGCVLQGLGGALFEAVDFKQGELLNASISGYRVPRFADIPNNEVVLLDRKDLPPAGAGEAPIVAVAPAIRNAIFEVTGKKLNHLPMIPGGTVIV